MKQDLRSLSSDTITAQATPPGRGGIAIVRVSGPLVKKIMYTMLKQELAPRQATHLSFCDATNTTLDIGVAIFFPGPHSFTGEDVLELHGHGGPIVVDLLLQCILSLGARLARPGEFSERAFLNGKVDLAQAEAIADLIDASSQQAARSALRSLQGEFSQAIQLINEKIIQLRVYVEAAMDFADEEIDLLSDAKILNKLQAILTELICIQQKAKQGSFLREGITVVIAGAPNVGKSSLLNRLSGKDIAIVTAIPGTTRDVLRDTILIDGMPMHVIDTAGLRDSDDVVEQEGIRRAYNEIENADIIIYVTDAREQLSNVAWMNAKRSSKNKETQKNIILIRNKIDLTNELATIEANASYTTISLSVKSGLGMDILAQHIKTLVGFQPAAEGTYLARRRHLTALEVACQHLQSCLVQLKESSGELAAEELRRAHLALADITGKFTADDLLGHIFSSFCIGK